MNEGLNWKPRRSQNIQQAALRQRHRADRRCAEGNVRKRAGRSQACRPARLLRWRDLCAGRRPRQSAIVHDGHLAFPRVRGLPRPGVEGAKGVRRARTSDERLAYSNMRDFIVAPMQKAGMPVRFRTFDGKHVIDRGALREALAYALDSPAAGCRQIEVAFGWRFRIARTGARTADVTDKPTRDDWEKLADKEVARQGPVARDGRGDPADHRLRPGRRGIDSGYPGLAPFTRGPYATMYAGRPVDDPPICRLLDRRGIQRLLSPQPRRRAEGPLGRLRSRHPPRLRQRQSARRRRRRHGGRRDRHGRGHEIAVRRHPAWARCRSA